MNVKPVLDYLTDVFSGADGGVSFVRFRMFMEEMGRRADDGDVAAARVVRIAEQFKRLVEVAQRK